LSKQFPHVHSFRLSDEGEGYLSALMRRFNINFSREQSPAFRLLLQRLSHFFREIDSIDDSSQSQGDGEGEIHSAAQELIIRVGDYEMEKEAIPDYMTDEVRGKLGIRLRNLTVWELKNQGIPCFPQNMVSQEMEIRKRYGIPLTNIVEDAEERKRFLNESKELIQKYAASS